MGASAHWNGQEVSVVSTLTPRFLWQTASIDVYLGEECVLRTGGQLKVTGAHKTQFTHAGDKHEAVLTWGRASLRSFPVTLAIDGIPVLDSRVYTSNWAVGLWPFAAVAGALFFWLAK